MYLPQLAQGWNFSVAGNAVVSFKKPEMFKKVGIHEIR